MKITWLGQAGLLLESGKTKIMIDPYLSDCVERVEPKNFRRVPIKNEIFDVEPDVMIFTHDHLDHFDPETAAVFLKNGRKPMTVLSPFSVWQKARAHGKCHNYVLFNKGTEWTEGELRFRAVGAAHSDVYAIGVIIQELQSGKTYYVTGDTLYDAGIFAELPKSIDLVFLPVNGVGNNMNAADALRFFENCGAKRAVAYHVGMFDSLTSDIFKSSARLDLELYEAIEIN